MTRQGGTCGEVLLPWKKFDRLVCQFLGAIHLLLGLVTIAGGVARFPPPNYAALLSFTDGRVWPYAALWMIGGAAMVIGRVDTVRMTGLLVSIGITNLWAALFTVSALEYKDASFTAGVAYGGYGALSALLLGFMLVHRRPIRKGG